MNKFIYPAIFITEEEGYSVIFPDLEGCHTQGDTLEEALDMAKDALSLYIFDMIEDKKEKLTFGNLMEKLRKNPNFKGFVDRIEAEKVGEVRNSAVHTRPISKYECGKIRKIILEDGWLDRISFLVEESLKVKKDSYIEYDMFIIEKLWRRKE